MLRANGYSLYFHEFLYKNEGDLKEKKYEIDFMIVNNHQLR